MPNRFGMGWNISDILGGLGDAISVGAGGESNYLNQLQKDRYADGLTQFNNGDQVGGLAMLAKSQGPKYANEWADNTAQAQARKAVNETTQARNAVLNRGTEAEIRDKQAEYDKDTRGRYFGMLGAANEGNYKEMKAQADAYAAARGWKPDVKVPEVFTKGWADDMRRSELAPKDWASEAESRRYHDITADRQERDLQSDVGFKNADMQLKAAKLLQDAVLGGQRVVTGERNATSGEVRASATAQNAATAQNRATASVIANIVKSKPGALIERSNRGKVRYSTDGGKNWTVAN